MINKTLTIVGDFLFNELFIGYEPPRKHIKNQKNDGDN